MFQLLIASPYSQNEDGMWVPQFATEYRVNWGDMTGVPVLQLVTQNYPALFLVECTPEVMSALRFDTEYLAFWYLDLETGESNQGELVTDENVAGATAWLQYYNIDNPIILATAAELEGRTRLAAGDALIHAVQKS